MKASKLAKVKDGKGAGKDFRPSAGVTGSKVGALAKGNSSVLPKPKAAANSGKKPAEPKNPNGGRWAVKFTPKSGV